MENLIDDERALCLNGIVCNNISRFLNHQCYDANLFDIPIQIENNVRHIYHVCFFIPFFCYIHLCHYILG